MANVNSSQGWVSLPAQTIPGTSATALLVPASTAQYQGLPSPIFAAGAGLYLQLDPNYQSSNPYASSPTYVNSSVDGRPFLLRVVGVVTVAASSTFVCGVYNGTSSTLTNDTLIAASASYTITTASSINFIMDIDLLWDSVSSKLNGQFSSNVNNTFTGGAAITSISSLSVTNLSFIPAFTFGTNAGTATVTVKEFLFQVK